MKILVLSCDKNSDTFEPFHHCMEKYWSNHPEVIYKTETITNPYYKTICTNYPLSRWTEGVRETLRQIDDNQILIMIDDCFIRKPVDEERIKYASEHLVGNIATFNFEKSFDPKDEDTGLQLFLKRQHNSSYEVSIMCGLWDKTKLSQVLAGSMDPWQVEFAQNNCGYDYYINGGDYIIDWGYKTWQYAGICRGKWCREVVPFFEREGIVIDYAKRGFINEV
jgi:hypothetical protein